MTPVPQSRRRRPEDSPLSKRSRAILAAVVRSYVERGEPVSSLWLTRHGRFGVSSATVRNTMAELEHLGYVHQPHTSAGRVPTDRGYRCYVDLLLEARRPARSSANVEARLRRASTVDDLLTNVSHELSRASHSLGFALAPSGDAAAFRQIDFVPLDRQRVLVVVVSATGQVSHKVVDLPEAMRPVDLTQAANYLNGEFAGLPLCDVRAAILERLEQERTLYDALRARALRLARDTFQDLPESLLFVQGTPLLLDDASDGDDPSSIASLRSLFAMIEEKGRLVRLLSRYIDDPGLTIIIGTEHRTQNLQSLSLIASTYFDGRQTGCVGIIGPRRMRYARSIAAVDGVSRTVSHLLGPTDGGAWTN
ncbi:MAG: heat-inducible transcriptional repressor HrcA [Vicinamibacterales bacterium]|jgi:heat-inducible transcriptional repressor|nr:heat-inducible transcriptional repressor HrcA [Vicinamibacterales bacterium]MDP6609352.1 heat-inducible transcriptional repressor HrcA [Vicinamibacterales bacterium]HAK57186.1 heat-inducible transcription repressor HrcA [Acidobacteriota bacterium]